MDILRAMRRSAALCIGRPYVRRELPGWGRVYNTLVGGSERDGDWQGLGQRWQRGKLHGYEMLLDISRWSNRKTFFLNRFYDLETQSVLKAILKEGDTFVDIGANEGMMSLLAARLVGSTGRIVAFEPSPGPRGIFEAAIARNHIQSIDLRPIGLSDAEATLKLAVPRINSGQGSFARPRYADDEMDEVDCPVRIGDRELDDEAPCLIKIDVEGFEEHVIRGLGQTLQRTWPPVAMEVVATHLRRAGSSVETLATLMEGFGYTGLATGLAGRHRLTLKPAILFPAYSGDVLWIHKSDPLLPRMLGTYGQ